MRLAPAQTLWRGDCCVLALAWPAQGQDGGGEPYELVRSLQSLQDQIARGNARAHANQRVLIGRIAEQFDSRRARNAGRSPRTRARRCCSS